MTNPNKGKTSEQADDLAIELGLLSLVEEYELADIGHVYTLFDGSALVIPYDDEEPYVLVNEVRVTTTNYLEGMMN